MEKGARVKDIMANAEVEGLFAAVEPSLKEGKNGWYWRLGLSDSTGVIEAKIWPPLSGRVAGISSGVIALVRGRASLYRETLQINISSFDPLSKEDSERLDLSDFIKSSPYDGAGMLTALRRACLEEFKHPPWLRLASSVFKDRGIRRPFSVMPAAKSMHHAYAGGLLEHTLSVFTLCRSLCDRYPDLDRQTLLAGALFHDIGKIREFSGGLDNDYTGEGRLIGHISLGLGILEPFLAECGLEEELKTHLKHLILSHHGLHEYGAPILPQTPEAFALHYADNMDAKMNQFHNLFADAADQGPAWSGWQSGLERKIYRAPRTPGQDGALGAKHGAGGQCLSLWKE